MGKIIIIEGLDGCGKSTQLALLKGSLPECRFLTFPNYSSPSGEIVSDYLRGGIPDTDPVHSAYSASTFYAADRYISFRKDWYVDYAAGRSIVSARYTTSNAVYQMTKLERSGWDAYFAWLYDYEYRKLGIPAPDAVLFLDVPVEVSQKLLTKRYGGSEQKKDIHEADPAYLRRCREAMLYAAAHDSFSEWQLVECCENGAMRPAEEIHAELCERIAAVLNA